MHTKPQKEHQWLEKLVGDWTYESEASMGPDKPAEILRGTETVRSIGGLWIVAEGKGECPGEGPGVTVLTIGFDPAKNRFIGTWVGSMMANMWIYEGSLDASGKKLALMTEGPSMSGDNKTIQYRDEIEWVDDNRRLLISSMQGDDGNWVSFMTSTYHRK